MLITGIGGSLYLVDARGFMMVSLGVMMSIAFGFVGFIDDYIKVVRKRNLGLSERQKLMMQFTIAALYILAMYIFGYNSTRVDIPFMGQISLGLAYYPIAIAGIVFMINVVNFTDGIDGLCASVTFVSSLGFLLIAGLLHQEGMSVMAAALAGGTLGFLVWNMHPARIFMGDTGSMFLGGMIVALAFGLQIPAFLIFLGIIYIIEGLTVMIQTTYFKYTRRKYGQGRRIFKMTPIHHHFEMMGWGESKIVCVFSFIQLIFAVFAVYAVMIM
jgi:phospho-N-acetylmuramoyl-pentapeptide-transferase